ncbi:hypothetical protein EHS25_005506 [Saitozyma podzolica]|uniref:Alkyl sulfatase dimerisation domain-containing protein n=1 Tax=Saitozyma podzolica TaxID=1890683 RepID=A0A427XXQ5_9TREE|nr:hypothetical protein EHS25_005506 [Saitozyma podzolica]
MTCILAPDSEAPSECLFHLPRQSAVCAPKDATHTMHNLYTLRARGQVPGRVEMAKYLPKALDIFGAEMQVAFASPHWQTWDHEHWDDAARYRRADKTAGEPRPGVWPNRGYYGSLYHNARAQYGFYLCWFAGVPPTLHSLPPTEAGKRKRADSIQAGRSQRQREAHGRIISKVKSRRESLLCEKGADAA